MAVDFKDLMKIKWYYQVLIVAAVCGALLAGVWYQFLTPIEVDIQTRTAKMDELQKTIEANFDPNKRVDTDLRDLWASSQS